MADPTVLQQLRHLRHGAQAQAVPALAAAAVRLLVGDEPDTSPFSLAADATCTVQAALLAVRALFADALAHGVSEAKFEGALRKMGLAPEVGSALSGTLFSGKLDALAQIRARVAARLGGQVLTDYDWAVNHVVSSAKLGSVSEALVTLTLRSGEDGAVVLELAPKDLDALIAQLETALDGGSVSG